MTLETIKGLLMILMIGSLLGAVRTPKTSASRPWAFLVRAITHLRSAIVPANTTLQPAFVRRKSHHRRALR